MKLRFISFFLFSGCLVFGALAEETGFAWKVEEGKYADLSYDGKKVARYVFEGMDPERREETYKPFHHVYDAKGEAFLTKGPGGKFTHHRGIYFGFSKCTIGEDGGRVDTWHCRGGYQLHEEVLKQEAGAESALQRVRIAWKKDDGTTFLTEERQLEFRLGEKDELMVDFTSKLSTTGPFVHLDGDPQHAGFQFRASNEVAESTSGKTYYIRPETGKAEPGKTINLSKDKGSRDDPRLKNLPWKAMSFVLGESRYTTLYLDHPDNPKPAIYSERDYGRFGSYFVAKVTPEMPVEVNYRLVIRSGELTAEDCQAFYAKWVP